MITYRYKEEREVALHFAHRLSDDKAQQIIESDDIRSKADASYLSEFFWRMNIKAIADDASNIAIPCEGSSEYWLEKIYISWEGYMLKMGFSEQ